MYDQKETTLELDGVEYQALWAAAREALSRMRALVLQRVETEFDEDAGIFRTTTGLSPDMTHLLALSIEALSGFCRQLGQRRRGFLSRSFSNQGPPRPVTPSDSWLGISVVPNERYDQEGLRGGVITIAPQYTTMFYDLMALIFQHALVLAPSAQEWAVAEHQDAVESGDAAVCYAAPANRTQVANDTIEAFKIEREEVLKTRRTVLRKVLRLLEG